MIRRDRALVSVTIMLDVAFYAGRQQIASAADIAERVGLARRGLEPTLQSLSRAGLLESVRGPKGGYRLGRPARDILLAEIFASVVGSEEQAECELAGSLQAGVIEPLWAELDEAVRERLAPLTLGELVRRAEARGLQRPVTDPISFVI